MAGSSSPVGLREVARELDLDDALISYWVKKGWVTVLQRPQHHGDKLLLDRQSVLDCLKARKKKDRRWRGRRLPTPPRPQAHPTPPPGAPTPLPSPSPAEASPTWPSAEIFGAWLVDLQASNRSPAYLGDLRYRVTPFIRACPTLPVPREVVLAHVNASPGNKVSQHILFRYIRAFLEWAERMKGIPAPNLKHSLAVPKWKPKDHLNEEECGRLLNATRNLVEWSIVALFLETGIRTSALASLRQDNIHQGVIRVKDKGKDQEYVISADLEKRLRLLGKPVIFQSRFGKPYTLHGIYQLVQALLQRAGIKKSMMGGHLLRHTSIYLKVKYSHDIRAVQQAVGHSSVVVTENYANLEQEDLKTFHRQYNPLQAIMKLNSGEEKK